MLFICRVKSYILNGWADNINPDEFPIHGTTRSSTETSTVTQFPIAQNDEVPLSLPPTMNCYWKWHIQAALMFHCFLMER